MEQDELDPGRVGRLRGRERLGDAEIVELPDRRVAGREHLAVRPLVLGPNEIGSLPLGLREHRVAPRPEVAARGAPAHGALERVAVRVHEARESERARHARDASRGDVLFRRVLGQRRAARSRTRSRIARFAAIPIFVWLYLDAGDGAAWGAGIFFAGAALTDQLDGYLARRWHVESRFGKVADPLADRLMIGTAAVLMLATGRIPILAALVILGRDVILVLGYKILSPGGLRARRHLPRQDGHLGAVRLARPRARHARGDDVAARPPLDRHRALARERGAVRATRVEADASGRDSRAEVEP